MKASAALGLPRDGRTVAIGVTDGTEQRLNGLPPDLDELHSLWTTEAFPYTGRPPK